MAASISSPQQTPTSPFPMEAPLLDCFVPTKGQGISSKGRSSTYFVSTAGPEQGC